jgi:hypothetical protein
MNIAEVVEKVIETFCRRVGFLQADFHGEKACLLRKEQQVNPLDPGLCLEAITAPFEAQAEGMPAL